MNKLPDELVQEIVNFSDPLFVEQAIKCSQLYSSRTHLLDLCLVSKRLRRFALVRLYIEVRIDSTDRMHRLLRSILRNRSLGALVKNLSLDWDDEVDKGTQLPHWAFPDPRDKQWKSRDSSELEEFYQAALEYGLDPTEFECVKTGSESAMALILLCSLPNLTDWVVQPPYAKGLFEDFGTHIGSRFLKKVKFVGYLHYDTVGGYYIGNLFPFFLLTSILSIDATLTYGEEAECTPNIEKYYRTSSVETIRITYSNIDGSTLSRILQLPRFLKIFIYMRDCAVGGGVLTNRHEFSQAFINVSETLEYLSLKWDHRGHDDTTFDSLRHLKALKALSVGFDDILGAYPSTAMRLADVLPPNLEALLLHAAGISHWTTRGRLNSVRQLLDDKMINQSILPNLKKIDMRGRILEPLIGMGARVGVEIGGILSGLVGVSNESKKLNCL